MTNPKRKGDTGGRMTQTTDILKALQEGRMLTPIDALNEFGCFRLAARIKDLRDAGHEIETYTITQNGKQYAAYSLSQGQMEMTL